MTAPAPKQIYDLRVRTNLTQTQAAAVIYRKLRTWQDWESGNTKMDPALWELFKIKVKE